MSKSNQITLSNRIAKVIDMLLVGYSRLEIVQYASKNWRITERQADNYISKGKDELEKTVSRKIEYNLAKAEKRYEVIYKSAMKKGDLRTALATNKEIASLQGLYKAHIEQSGEVVFVSNIPD